MESKKTKSIGKSLLVSITIAVIAICAVLGVVGYRMFSNGMDERYRTYLNDLLTMTQTQIDGDDIAACIESGRESAAFKEIQTYLDTVKESYDIEYIYIVKPLNAEATDNMMDVMSAVTAKERAEDEEFYSVKLGELTGNAYPADVAAKYLAGMDSNGTTYFINKTEYGNDYTGMVPIRDSAGNAVAVLAADVSMSAIQKTLTAYLTFVIIFTLALAGVVEFSLYRWLSNRVVSPLARLKDVSEEFVESSRTANGPDELVVADPDIHTGDEMEALSGSLSDMFDGMKRYMSDLLVTTKEKERMGTELSMAMEIQASQLPRLFPAFPERPEFDIFASMTPAKEVGGDFYDFFMVDDDHIALVMADVSGKGVPAALFMMVSRVLIKSHLQAGESPARALMSVNDQLCENNDADLFVTVWIGVMQISTGMGIAANAGHEHPAVRRAGGEYNLRVYRHSPAIGMMEGILYREHEFIMSPGDSLFVYTDGVPEATDKHDKLYGTDSMLEALNKDPGASPEQTLANVTAGIAEFVGDEEQFDDTTMLCLRYEGPQA